MFVFWIHIAVTICLWMSWLKSRHWLVQGFRAQLAQLATIILVLSVVMWFCDISLALKVMSSIIATATIYYTSAQILPFTRFVRPEVPSGSHCDLQCLTANVRMKNRNYKQTIKLIRMQDPDIVLLTEVDEQWTRALESLHEAYPHQILMPFDNTYGMALYSKHQLSNSSIKFLVDKEVPSIHTTIEISSTQKVQFLGLHPKPPAPYTKEENKDLEILIAASLTNDNILPTIVAGDLNDVAWSPTTKHFKFISRLRDPRVGRGFYSTYNVFIPGFRMPIDHFFVSKHFAVSEMSRMRAIGSDHFPISISLSLLRT